MGASYTKRPNLQIHVSIKGGDFLTLPSPVAEVLCPKAAFHPLFGRGALDTGKPLNEPRDSAIPEIVPATPSVCVCLDLAALDQADGLIDGDVAMTAFEQEGSEANDQRGPRPPNIHVSVAFHVSSKKGGAVSRIQAQARAQPTDLFRTVHRVPRPNVLLGQSILYRG